MRSEPARPGEISLHFVEIPPRGCSYRGKPAGLGGLARLGEMIFIPSSYEIFYLNSVKKFVMLLKKKIIWSSSFYNKQWHKAIM